MFINDLKKDFYNRLLGKRVLIIVNYDVDAICASKILQTLLKFDHVVYTVVPVMGVAGVKRAFAAHRQHVKNVLFLNCAGSLDVVELLLPSEDCTFFICDCHRPYDVCNIYSDRQVGSMISFYIIIIFYLYHIPWKIGLHFGGTIGQ